MNDTPSPSVWWLYYSLQASPFSSWVASPAASRFSTSISSSAFESWLISAAGVHVLCGSDLRLNRNAFVATPFIACGASLRITLIIVATGPRPLVLGHADLLRGLHAPLCLPLGALVTGALPPSPRQHENLDIHKVSDIMDKYFPDEEDLNAAAVDPSISHRILRTSCSGPDVGTGLSFGQ
ncbi:hypothetical protein DFH06DRAFT_1324827 [Mycena polygramma]|nr:hypothetical protein DFH06DRAFT_1324827 [Mycena polygramma]